MIYVGDSHPMKSRIQTLGFYTHAILVPYESLPRQLSRGKDSIG